MKVGDGSIAFFWKSNWIGSRSLAEQYPKLFEECSMKDSSIKDMRTGVGDDWIWNLWNGNEVLGHVAIIEHAELCGVLDGLRVATNEVDRFVWPYDSSNIFSVKSCYALMARELGEAVMDENSRQVLDIMWGAKVPSKLKVFGWRLIQDRLPTKNLLLRRGILQQMEDVLCVFCHTNEEDVNHVFLLCPRMKLLWCKILNWLNILNNSEDECRSHLLKCVEAQLGKIERRRVCDIWMTTCWCVWRKRNDIVFNNAELDIDELFFMILRASWWWLSMEAKDRLVCSFYEWYKNPLLCL
ncbi:uncharacterized protein LOC131604515 [Vicia villosa]|uniref:uncharacterized protein LOC131604515 n=1 Tax=Vicia villosa TaxID=3911 RepID=UPI00273BC0AD|nr:uncharacterized protein LOC131604515 [Vicia villosa]